MIQNAIPGKLAFAIYLGFLLFESLLAFILPGFVAYGLPVASLGGKKLKYVCNAFQSWWVTFIIVAVSQYMGWINMARIVDLHGQLLTVAVIVADILAVSVYVSAHLLNKVNRASGNLIYDFFMGINLNPRIGILDIKLFCEVRISWIILFFLTFSAACKQYQDYGYISNSMIIMIIAHLYYCNACCKGEQLILPSWDIIYENFGWMLSFWNLAGVPFSYCFASMFLARHAPLNHSWLYAGIVIAALLFASWVHDTGNAQKSTFRQIIDGTYRKRYTFPQLPWAKLENPKYLKTKSGSLLLIDGWYKYARKIHYTADIAMALIWGMSCGFTHFLPYFYFVFFFGMITHRYLRDVERMKNKYGEDYERYCKIVPWVFIPGIY